MFDNNDLQKAQKDYEKREAGRREGEFQLQQEEARVKDTIRQYLLSLKDGFIGMGRPPVKINVIYKKEKKHIFKMNTMIDGVKGTHAWAIGILTQPEHHHSVYVDECGNFYDKSPFDNEAKPITVDSLINMLYRRCMGKSERTIKEIFLSILSGERFRFDG